MENIKKDFVDAQKTMDFSKDVKAKKADYTQQVVKNNDGISHDLDSIFEANRANIPLAFLRAFAWNNRKDKTKGFNPSQSSGGAAGLFGISTLALDAYNKAKDQNNPIIALADAVFNTKVAVYLLQKIVAYYAANYPKTMIENWESPDYVALVVHGYNAGHSEPKGIGTAIKKFNDKPGKLSFDAVVQVAKELKLPDNTFNQAWAKFAKDVANTYMSLIMRPGSPVEQPMATKPVKRSGGLGLAALAGLVGLGVVMKGKR